ncbi:MAG: hypothetical protein AAGI63_03855, partial [Planctomycetota bacterium]
MSNRHEWPTERVPVAYASLFIAAIAVVVASITPSPVVHSLVVLPIAIGVTYWIIARQRQHDRLRSEYFHDVDLEMQSWQQRWRTLQREAHQTTTALSRMRDGVI